MRIGFLDVRLLVLDGNPVIESIGLGCPSPPSIASWKMLGSLREITENANASLIKIAT